MTASGPTPQAPTLPKLRKGLTYSFSDYDYDGKPLWLIHDASRNKFFIVGWPDYEMLMRWNLGNPEELISAVNSETTLHVEMSDLENLCQFLAHNFLIEQSGKKIIQSAKEQGLFKDDNIISWLISHYLFFRIPLWHPDNFLNKTRRFGDFLFSPYLMYTMIFLGITALYQITMRWDDFTGTFSSMISWRGLLLYFVAFSLVKIMHEAGHAYKCKSYDIPVPTCGLAFLVFWPVLYTDTTLSWTLNNKKRMRIALAGMQIETYVTIIAALIWCNTSNITLAAICYVTITINWMSSLLINVSPFMRFDGYYVLADFMKMPNLQYRAFSLTRWQLRKWLFAWPDPPPERFSRKMHNFLIIYSIVTWIYRLTLYIGIALLVYFMFFKVLGIILLLVEVYYFILAPFVSEFKVWIQLRQKFSLNINTVITLTVTFILLGLFFIPFSQSVELPATMHYAHQFLFSPEEGILGKPLPPPGTKIKANSVITQIESPAVNYSLVRLKLEYDKLLNEARRASLDNKFAQDKNAIISNINKKKSEYDKLLEVKNKLTITVPFNGIITDVASELSPGSYVRKDEWLGDVINPSNVEVEAYVSQIDLNLLANELTGYFYPEDFSQPKVPVTLKLIEPLNPTQLNCQYANKPVHKGVQRTIVETPCYNSSEFGGLVPTYITDKGEYVPVDSVHRVIFQAHPEAGISYIQRGVVTVKTSAHSYAYRLFYQIKKVFVQEKTF